MKKFAQNKKEWQYEGVHLFSYMKNNHFEAPSTSRLALHHDIEKFPQKWQDRIPSQQSKIITAIQSVLEPQVYIVKDGDTVGDVARIFNIGVPPSLFGVKPGQEWVLIGNSMVNQYTGTVFPVHPSANEDQFTLVA